MKTCYKCGETYENDYPADAKITDACVLASTPDNPDLLTQFTYHFHNVYDLCPDCMGQLRDFLFIKDSYVMNETVAYKIQKTESEET